MNPLYRGIVLVLLASFATVGVSCKEGYSRYQKELKKFEEGYTSSDVRLVEQALIAHRNAVLEMQAKHVEGINFDHILWIVSARMSCFYDSLGRTNEAQQFYIEATNHMSTSAKANQTEVAIPSKKELCQLVQHADSYLDVKWKSKQSGPPQ